jgi:hypothetical protein
MYKVVLIARDQTNEAYNKAMREDHSTLLKGSDQHHRKPIWFYAWEIDYEGNFLIRQLMERYMEQKKDMNMVFIDLEKVYDKVLRNVIWWAMQKHEVSTKYITLIKDMYDNVMASVRTSYDGFVVTQEEIVSVTMTYTRDQGWH